MEDSWGVERPVMHACAHDMHATYFLAASSLLLAAKESWSGTLLLLFQLNEEWLGGAQAMIDDGFYDKIPLPDLVLGQHVVPLKSGTLALSFGPVLAAADSIDIRINSSGPGVSTRQCGPYPRSCAYPRPHSHPRHRTERDDVSDMSPVSQRLAWCRLSSLRRYDRLESHNPGITQGYDQPSATVLPNTRGVLP
jgi:hypothetical protein